MNNKQIQAEIPTLNYSKILPWSIFAVGILYYCFAYLLRVFPSVMEHDMMRHFGITASGFGLFTSFYYFAYAPMQLPVGMAVDKIGPRKSLLFACTLCILALIVFINTDSYAIALVDRFVIGMGAAFAYVTALKIASVWLPRKYFASATGLVTSFGMVAAIFTDNYLTHLLKTVGYAKALYFPLFVGLTLLVLIFFMIRDKKPEYDEATTADPEHEKHAASFKELFQQLLEIGRNKQMWLIGLLGAVLYLPASVFLDVWVIPYLETAYAFTAEQAAQGFSVMLGGWIISSFATGFLSDMYKTRKIPLFIASIGAFVISSCILYMPGLAVWQLFTLLFLFGIFCGPHPLCFTLSKENNPIAISGTSVAFANFLIMMGGFLFQPIVGSLLDVFWQGGMQDGIRVYTTASFVKALSIMPVGLLLGCVMMCFIKETAGKQVEG